MKLKIVQTCEPNSRCTARRQLSRETVWTTSTLDVWGMTEAELQLDYSMPTVLAEGKADNTGKAGNAATHTDT